MTVRYELLLPLCLAIVSLSFAPAPLPRRGQGPAVDAVLSLPASDPGRAAERAGSLAEVEAAFGRALWADEYRGKTPSWVHARLRVKVIGSGEALRLTLSGYAHAEEQDGLALLDLLVQKHVPDRIPARRACMAAQREAVGVMKRERGGTLREEDLRAIRKAMREYREANRKEDAIVLQQPAVRHR